MNAHQNAPVPVVLRRRVIVDEGLVFEAERSVMLPIPPFIGLLLIDDYRPEKSGSDDWTESDVRELPGLDAQKRREMPGERNGD